MAKLTIERVDGYYLVTQYYSKESKKIRSITDENGVLDALRSTFGTGIEYAAQENKNDQR